MFFGNFYVFLLLNFFILKLFYFRVVYCFDLVHFNKYGIRSIQIWQFRLRIVEFERVLVIYLCFKLFIVFKVFCDEWSTFKLWNKKTCQLISDDNFQSSKQQVLLILWVFWYWDSLFRRSCNRTIRCCRYRWECSKS